MKGLQAVLTEKEGVQINYREKRRQQKVIITVILSIAVHGEEADDTV